jgi:hypothetical protein
MAFLVGLLFKIAFYVGTLIYPAYKAYQAQKNEKIERIWSLYWLVLGVSAILEMTILWPVKFM